MPQETPRSIPITDQSESFPDHSESVGELRAKKDWQAEAGNLDILEADWNEAFVEDATNSSASKFNDQVDAVSGAFLRHREPAQ